VEVWISFPQGPILKITGTFWPSFDVENGRNRLAHGDVEVLGAGVALDIDSGGLVFRLAWRHDYMGDISCERCLAMLVGVRCMLRGLLILV
jgi:hypothetical protein